MKTLKSIPFIIAYRLFLTIILIYSADILLAQKNNIKATAISELKFSFEYERALTSKSSLLLGYRQNNTGHSLSFYGPTAPYVNQGERITLSYRYYFLQNASRLEGIYFAPIASYGHHKVKHSQGCHRQNNYLSNKEKVKAIGIGLNLGTQKRWKFFDIDFGVNLTKNIVVGEIQEVRFTNGTSEKFKSDIDGFRPEIYFGIGFAF